MVLMVKQVPVHRSGSVREEVGIGKGVERNVRSGRQGELVLARRHIDQTAAAVLPRHYFPFLLPSAPVDAVGWRSVLATAGGENY